MGDRFKPESVIGMGRNMQKHRIVALLNSQSSVLKRLIKQTIIYFSQTIEAVREGRQYPRKLKNIKNDIHFPAYKSAL